jgi:ribosomal-protein-alanine N-acetyltransferase
MIRCAETKDILSIVKIEKAALKETLGEKFLYQEINDNPLALYYVYELNREVIGYIGFRLDLEIAEMMNFVVLKLYQNEGYGQELIKYALNQLIKLQTKSISLEVRESNLRAQYIYEKLGFKQSHKRKKYYKNEDAIVYIKEV